MEAVLIFVNIIIVGFAWYFIGRSSIYRKLIKDYKEALSIIGEQRALLACLQSEVQRKRKERKEENGEQD